jgi:uncharacterized LabA/DUF88 family protein
MDEQAVERVYAAVDISNLWHSCRDIFGPTARVNYDHLLKKIKSSGYKSVPREVTAVAYAVTAPHRRVSEASGRIREEPSRNTRFLESLKKFGYEVKVRVMRYEKGIDKPFHTDWDVGIAVDAITTQNEYDTFILVSGDGDYIPLIQRLQKTSKRVEVYTFERTASQTLYSVADNVVFLTLEDTYQEKV